MDLLLLLAGHAQLMHKAVPSRGGSMTQEAAGLLTCLAALWPLQILVTQRRGETSLVDTSRSLLLASLKRHEQQRGFAVVLDDAKSERAKSMYSKADPCPNKVLEQLSKIKTLKFAWEQPDVVVLADAWAH